MAFIGLSWKGWVVYAGFVVIGLATNPPLGPSPAAAVGGLVGVLLGAYIITTVGFAIFTSGGKNKSAD